MKAKFDCGGNARHHGRNSLDPTEGRNLEMDGAVFIFFSRET
jgi:hypothetical protein